MDNALKCGDVSSLNIADVDLDSSRLWVLGKGRGSRRKLWLYQFQVLMRYSNGYRRDGQLILINPYLHRYQVELLGID